MDLDPPLPHVVGNSYEPLDDITGVGAPASPDGCNHADVMNNEGMGVVLLDPNLDLRSWGISASDTDLCSIPRPQDFGIGWHEAAHGSGGGHDMAGASHRDEQGGSCDDVVSTSSIRGEKMLWLVKDDTDQKHGAAPPRWTKEHRQDVIRRTPVLTFILTADGTIRYQNSAVQEVLGRGRRDLLGTNVVDLVHPDDLHQLTETLAPPSHQGSFDLRFRCWDGSWRALQPSSEWLPDDVQTATFVLNARDAAAYEHAEASLLHLAAINDVSNDAIFMFTRDGIILDWNHRAEYLFGFARDEIVGQPVSLLIPADGDEGHQTSDALWRGSGVERVTTGWVRKDGQKIAVAMVSVLIRNDGGQGIGFSVTAREISERTRATKLLRQTGNELERCIEERNLEFNATNARQKAYVAVCEQAHEDLKTHVAELCDQVKLLDLVHHAVLVRDFATGAVLSWNSGAEEMYGWAKDEAVGQICDELLQSHLPQSRAKIESQLLQVGHWEGEIEQTRRTGDRIVVECWWALRRDEWGQPAFILEVNRNITMRRQAETEQTALLATAQEYSRRLEDIAVLKADFTTMVAHELSSPIAAIHSLADLLTHAELRRDDQDRALAMIRNEANVLHTLVQDVQAIASTERHDFTIQPQPVPIAVLLADAAAFNQTLPGRHQLITLIRTHQFVLADRERVGQVLRNLIGNAAKYSPDDAPIQLRTSEHGDRIRIEVVDHGPGIDKDDLPRIFKKFGRGRDACGRRRPGTGLGLYLSRRIARAHGSDLTVESTPGLGSVFGFELEIIR